MKKILLIFAVITLTALMSAEKIEIDNAFTYEVPDSMARIMGRNLEQVGTYVAVQDSLNRTQLISVYTKKNESDFTIMLMKINQIKWDNIEKIYQLKQKGEFRGMQVLYRERTINGIPVKQFIIGSSPKPMIHVYLKQKGIYRIDYYINKPYMKKFAGIIEKSINSISKLK